MQHAMSRPALDPETRLIAINTGVNMNDAFGPSGSNSSSDRTATSLSDWVADNPLVAVAASAAVGAGVMALVAAAARHQGSPSSLGTRAQTQASQVYADLSSQLGQLLKRVNAAVPSGQAVTRTAGDLGDHALHAIDRASESAKRALHGAASAGRNATQTVAEHPVLTSLVLAALGAVTAAIGAASKAETDGTPTTGGSDSADPADPSNAVTASSME